MSGSAPFRVLTSSRSASSCSFRFEIFSRAAGAKAESGRRFNLSSAASLLLDLQTSGIQIQSDVVISRRQIGLGLFR